MKYTAISIKNREFEKKMRGYDREEVESFLEELADEFERLDNENSGLKKELEMQNEKLESYFALEQSIKDTIEKAEENSKMTIASANATAKQTVDEANENSRMTIEEAEKKAEQMLQNAEENSARINSEAQKQSASIIENARCVSDEIKAAVTELREEKELILAKLKSFVKAQESVVEKQHDMPIKNKIEEIKQEAPVRLDINIENIMEKL